jgi:hypothetical protein
MCWKCGKPSEIEGKPGFRDLCPACGREIHVCKNCVFYLPGAYHDCRETVPDPVNDKERMNLCEYFRLNPAAFGKGGSKDGAGGAKGGREGFDRLFGGT